MGSKRMMGGSKIYGKFSAGAYATRRGPQPLYATMNTAATASEDEPEKEEKQEEKMGLYPWAVLGITVLVRVMV